MTAEEKRVFRLRVEPLGGDAWRLSLWQDLPGSNGRKPERRRVAQLEGTSLLVAMDQVLEQVRAAGYRGLRGGEVVRTRQRRPMEVHEFQLSETGGVRLGLLFLALRPLRRVERMERVVAGVRTMTDEEAYYWFSKCTARESGRRAQRALRILLAGE